MNALPTPKPVIDDKDTIIYKPYTSPYSMDIRSSREGSDGGGGGGGSDHNSSSSSRQRQQENEQESGTKSPKAPSTGNSKYDDLFSDW